ncbi:MAG: Fic family protein [Clostridiales Family XIII bacterium]|jgi:Fic family protein|nr:Fic family protein [Clostridiales Family XIII bacterium]
MGKYEDAVKLWRRYRVETEADIDLRLDNFRILFAYNSGKIENEDVTFSDTREIFENGRILNYTGSLRALFELSNQRLCYDFLKPRLAAKEPLSMPLIKEIQGILTGGTYDERRFVEQGERPGEFKKHDYVTGAAEVGSLPEDVENDLAELLGEIADYGDKDTLKVAAYFHARFEYIHPFADGNGRAGRTLLNYYLMVRGHPPVIIHDEDKRAYYDALACYDNSENLEPMAAFLRQQTERTWEKTLERESRRGSR